MNKNVYEDVDPTPLSVGEASIDNEEVRLERIARRVFQSEFRKLKEDDNTQVSYLDDDTPLSGYEVDEEEPLEWISEPPPPPKKEKSTERLKKIVKSIEEEKSSLDTENEK